MIWSCGLDVGRTQDYSAFTVLEVTGTVSPLGENPPVTRVAVKHLERFPLLTPYYEVANLVRDRLGRLKGEVYLSVDRTGVGDPVYEELCRPDQKGRLLNPLGVWISPGDTARRLRGREFSVPKRDLIAICMVMLQNGVLQFDQKVPFTDVMKREIQDFREKITPAGNVTYNAREGTHDDLLLSLAIAAYMGDQLLKLFAKLREQDTWDSLNLGGNDFDGCISAI